MTKNILYFVKGGLKMNKNLALVSFLVLGVMLLGFASATTTCGDGTTIPLTVVDGKTLLKGNIDSPVWNAAVTVICNGHTLTTESSNLGTYGVTFYDYQCPCGSEVNVSAIKGSLSGSNSAPVENGIVLWLPMAVVNVPMVPEFGVFAGALTLLSAVGIFFMVRRK